MAVSKVDAANQIENTLPIAQGGTGVTTGTLVLLSTATADDDASIAFDNTIFTDTYLTYLVIGQDIVGATDNQALGVQLSTDNGSSYTTSGYALVAEGYRSDDTNATAGFRGGAAHSRMWLTGTRHNHGNAANEKVNFFAYYYGLRNATSHKYCGFTTSFTADNGALSSNIGTTGTTNITAKVNNIRFINSSGNITSGKFSIYGVLL